MLKKSGFIAAVAFVLALAAAKATWAQVTPYLPPDAKLPRTALPPGMEPSPDRYPKEAGKVTVQMLFRIEEGLPLTLKAFEAPHDPSLHWQTKAIPPEELATAKIPIMKGTIDSGEAQITGPHAMKPGMHLMTVVVDNRKGTEDLQFYVPSPNPMRDMFVSSDTDRGVLMKLVPRCLCSGALYRVPKGGVWYRVVGLNIPPDTPTPSRVAMVMTLMRGPRFPGH